MELRALEHLPPVAVLLERCKRLYVLAALHWDEVFGPFCDLTVDEASFSIAYRLDTAGSEDAKFCVSPAGAVVFGFVNGVNLADHDRDVVRTTLARHQSLHEVTRAHRADWRASSFCAYLPVGESAWRVHAPYLANDSFREDSLGLCAWFVESVDSVSAEIGELLDQPARAVKPWLTDPWPKIQAKIQKLADPDRMRVQSRAIQVAQPMLMANTKPPFRSAE